MEGWTTPPYKRPPRIVIPAGLLKALAEIGYGGWASIFMHPVPRGIPILETTAAVTEEINRSRRYLEECLTRP